MRHLGRSGMVASPHYLATGSGLEVLRRGGNAIDAAIAVNAVLAVVTPYMCGMGGDLFAMVYMANEGALLGLNSSGRAPEGATVDRVRELAGGERMPERGPLTITVPGCVAGWGSLHRRYGHLPFHEVLRDAVHYAGQGFPASATFAGTIERAAELFHPGTPASQTFTPGGRAPAEGALFRQPRLAATLRALAAGGPEAYYQGEIAAEIARAVGAVGGLLSVDDLAAHRADWVEPLSLQYRDVTVFELPPNSQGVVALLILNLLRSLPRDAVCAGDGRAAHLMAEATRLAYADRDTSITDPECMTVWPERLLSEAYGRERAKLVGERAGDSALPGTPGDTAYMCTADGDGNVVSLIESNYLGIGSGVMAGETGVMLHNRGASFSLDPRHVNVVAPGKRPMHTLMPAMAFREGRPWLVFGTMGGSAQPQIQVEILAGLIDRGLALDEAIDAPRLEVSGGTGGPRVAVEHSFSRVIAEDLGARGWEVDVLPRGVPIGHAHAIEVLEDGVYAGAADPRTESLALGY